MISLLLAAAIHGTLLHPDSPTPVPVVLIISGSGPTDRDGNSMLLPIQNNSLRMLAEELHKAGIASLRYDKRGVGASAATATSESDLRFETYVEDARRWVQRLRDHKQFSTITVAGHSEGALIGTLAGADRVIAIAGPGRPAGDVLLSQLEPQLPADLMATSRAIVAALKEGRTVSDVPFSLFALFRPSVQPYLISWFRYDPAQEIGRLKVPVLIIQGTSDVQVSVDDAKRLAAANPTAKLVIIDGMSHVPIHTILVQAVVEFAKPSS